VKPQSELERAHRTLATIEVTQHRLGNVSAEQKAWFMGARAALAWALGLAKGGRKIDELVGPAVEERGSGLVLPAVVDPHVGSRAVDEMKHPDTNQ
jgi:hypothetical protein